MPDARQSVEMMVVGTGLNIVATAFLFLGLGFPMAIFMISFGILYTVSGFLMLVAGF